MSNFRKAIQRRRALFRFRPRPKSGRIRPESLAAFAQNIHPNGKLKRDYDSPHFTNIR